MLREFLQVNVAAVKRIMQSSYWQLQFVDMKCIAEKMDDCRSFWTDFYDTAKSVS